jgi:hypothetical protein
LHDVGFTALLYGKNRHMFVFFSNRLGCAGSLILSALLTLALVVLMRSCNHA